MIRPLRSTHSMGYRRQEVSTPGRSMCSSRVTAGNCLRWMQLGGGDCGMTTVGWRPRRYMSVREKGHMPQKCNSTSYILVSFREWSQKNIKCTLGIRLFVICGLILEKPEKKTGATPTISICCSLHETFVRLDPF